MLDKNSPEALSAQSQDAKDDLVLQLLLFVDKRPSTAEKIRQVRNYLQALKATYSFDLQIIDVSEQPHLAEHFKLVATPTLIKLHPAPRQTLAGGNLLAQIEAWWSRWQRSAEEYATKVLSQSEPSDRFDSASNADSANTGNFQPHNSLGNTIAYSTELIKLSDEIFRLKQEQAELREQLNFKDRLIAMLAHDLRNPLTAVSIALETLEMGNIAALTEAPRLKPETVAQLVKHARTQAKTIDRMITDVLQAARTQEAGLQIYPQQLDLDHLCLDVLSRLKPQSQAKSQAIETDIPADLPKVYADPERVQQVLVNLLDNAIKYTPSGGKINISILHRTMQKVQVSICDNGPGIPAENHEHIFEDRFRLKRDEAKEGYGIGLSLCQRVIRAHYGQIWVDSAANRGSCFHFTLPVYRS